ncbi:MAG: hypothetical protein CVT92_03755 [Bacteroidetes bacterium HGW-Bacteroidetes-1]|jgi:hypothetical protein|nr:MAG: hypothetical protein CVT92_03755 [Bacteroidetes bacterium HGW-Bacteroidetes-1]
MRLINIFTIPFLVILAISCVKPFSPNIESDKENKYVVSGKISSIGGWQEVSVSMSSPIDEPEFIPVFGCQIRILDNNGNSFLLEEGDAGNYRIWIGEENLSPGTSFKVEVYTPDGMVIESTYDTLVQGPALDSVYYHIEEVATTIPTVFMQGMQFYVDLNATGFDSKYYKWEIIETWEYHAAQPAENYYDGSFHQIIPPDYSNKICWMTSLVKNVYTISTNNLSQNAYQQYPLHFVDGHTSRLGIYYSILVKQQTLGEEAYNYWEKVRINSTEQGGLYEKQPVAIKGNLKNKTNPEKEVLGFFYVASESSKRLFYSDIYGITLTFTDFCNEEFLGRKGWLEYKPSEYPVYYYINQQRQLKILNTECVDCRLIGGTTTKPVFWP